MLPPYGTTFFGFYSSDKLSKYLLSKNSEEIGFGSYGTVYKVMNTENNEISAIKMFESKSM